MVLPLKSLEANGERGVFIQINRSVQFPVFLEGHPTQLGEMGKLMVLEGSLEEVRSKLNPA